MSGLRVRPHAADASGTVLEVTPASAGWRHVGFKLVRTTFGDLKDRIHFRTLHARLSSVVSKIKYLDNESMRGERKISSGIATDEGKALLNGLVLVIHRRLAQS